jgi:hypothetical protein
MIANKELHFTVIIAQSVQLFKYSIIAYINPVSKLQCNCFLFVNLNCTQFVETTSDFTPDECRVICTKMCNITTMYIIILNSFWGKTHQSTTKMSKYLSIYVAVGLYSRHICFCSWCKPEVF